MLHVCSLLWDANEASYNFSRCYDETWVEKLYRGFARNLTQPFRFVCFTEKEREFDEPIEQEPIRSKRIGYGACIEPYRLNQPMILVGLDTVIVGNCDHFADYCLTEKHIALPRDPYRPDRVCNGVALVPAGNRAVYDAWEGQNDMAWMRLRSETAILDDLFPGQIKSYKGSVMRDGVGDARIIYFHGKPKMHTISDDEILRHWI